MTQVPGAASPLQIAFGLLGLSTHDVWLRYLALGGQADEVSVAAQIHGFLDLPPGEYNVLAHTLNEELDELAEAYRSARVPLQQRAVWEGPRRDAQ
ncbi:hypothetical protein JD79_01886 [Geodermatophilus normandii]|uniref:Uncharacterized protein n=1 Tax=Geodermatophilus normandii TaxID=1137989 RepID=A0A317QIU5_9ACTN|nr:hypothetical protein [Geodermatophilus normandii]PWW22727.1 hypothetical protein JD79_01886 [Geodermatophilus normandii]